MEDTHTHPSPDGEHVVVLTHEGEIRFGPAYYTATLDGRPLEGRVFGRRVLWSDDSRFLVMQQWDNTVESRGAWTTLFVVRLADYGYDDTASVHGFMEEMRFEGSVLHYEQNRYGMMNDEDGNFTVGKVNQKVSHVDLDPLTGWKPLFP